MNAQATGDAVLCCMLIVAEQNFKCKVKMILPRALWIPCQTTNAGDIHAHPILLCNHINLQSIAYISASHACVSELTSVCVAAGGSPCALLSCWPRGGSLPLCCSV